jgi:hypothetical protein
MKCFKKIRRNSHLEFIGTLGWFRRILFIVLLSALLGACGTVVPAGRIAEGFFDAIRSADPEQFMALLDADTREKLEASMGNAELVIYLKEADDSLRSLYGDNWRSRILVGPVKPGQPAEESEEVVFKVWDVSVSIRGEQEGGQLIRVLEKDGRCYLDLSVMDDFTAAE